VLTSTVALATESKSELYALVQLVIARKSDASNSKDMIMRVPSEKDTCGLIIGTKGTRMKRIKARLQINHGIGVEWDKKSKEIVLASAVPLATERKSELYALVQLVMARQSDI
jgi:transcription antitermination factor NusA-like protein